MFEPPPMSFDRKIVFWFDDKKCFGSSFIAIKLIPRAVSLSNLLFHPISNAEWLMQMIGKCVFHFSTNSIYNRDCALINISDGNRSVRVTSKWPCFDQPFIGNVNAQVSIALEPLSFFYASEICPLQLTVMVSLSLQQVHLFV